MAMKPINISLTAELRAAVERRVRSGRYGSETDVLQAGLRALEREEMALVWKEWQQARKALPQEAISDDIEQRIEGRLRVLRRAGRAKPRR
jgi:antitoxin ParD1/3/4